MLLSIDICYIYGHTKVCKDRQLCFAADVYFQLITMKLCLMIRSCVIVTAGSQNLGTA